MRFEILTIFPDLLSSPLREGIVRRALEKELIKVTFRNLRDFTFDRHHTTDDRPYGGGEGMVMKAEPLALAVEQVKKKDPLAKVILLSPQGETYDQVIAGELSLETSLVLICGRYEGVDERFRERFVDREISLGDYILTGGELAAMVLVDSITRLLPGVLGCSDSAENDTFSNGLLKHPQYTRPRVFMEMEVPEVLLSGDHSQISEFRFAESVKRTVERRAELIRGKKFSRNELKILKKYDLYEKVRTLQQGKTSVQG
ncbi:tRNA (guanosine(37)-N1)-methyltransferase TrmD [Desulfomarina sp.]